MKVISGKLRGRVLKGYNIEGTRPTMDRVKESIFAIIQDRIIDSVVLDLFAGSGNLGIEAISNGANKCFFVDNNKECINVIKDNIRTFEIEDQCMVFKQDYEQVLNNFKNSNIKFDVIFIDPPYKYCIKNKLLKMIKDYNLLTEDGIIVYEYQNDEVVDNNISLESIKNKKYGDKYVSIYQNITKQ